MNDLAEDDLEDSGFEGVSTDPADGPSADLLDERIASPRSYDVAVPPPTRETGPGGGNAEGLRPGLLWERRAEVGALNGAMLTVRDVLISPAQAFASMRQTGGWADPVLFLMLFGTFGSFCGIFWQDSWRSIWERLLGDNLGQINTLNSLGMFSIVLAPLFVFLFATLMAGIHHLLLILFGGAPLPFETTFRTVAYSGGATALFSALPICGGLIGVVWNLVVLCIGLRESQEVPKGRAVAAVLVPTVFICMCFAFGLTLFIGMVGLGLSNLQ